MNFVSFEFWLILGLLLVPTLVIRAVLRKPEWDRWFLLAISCTLFAAESAVSFAIFVGIFLLIFATIRFSAGRGRQALPLILISALVALLPLLYFKYAPSDQKNFILSSNLAIPIGISFYTFQLISILVDSSREKDEKIKWLDLANYASFFPQIVAGPIERKKDLLPQVQQFRFSFDWENIRHGVQFIILGLFYKLVLADNLASAAAFVIKPQDNPFVIHLANITFGLRIYCDFCGYSLIAYGLAALFGIRVKLNFLSPYTAVNLQEFWRRWHITLSNWFRDYLYIPLGGNRTPYHLWVVLLVFVASGIWHGAGWGFLLWGGVHGLGLICLNLLGAKLKLPNFFSYLCTLAFVSITWLFFYETDSTLLFSKISTLMNPAAYFDSPIAPILKALGGFGDAAFLASQIGLCAVVITLEFFSRNKKGDVYAWGSPTWVQVLLIGTIIFLAPTQNNGFIYFNF